MDAVQAIYNRRAIRDFTDDHPPHEEIAALIDAAVQAPSGMNRQPWSFVVACGRPLLANWSARAKEMFLGHGQASALHGAAAHLAAPEFNIFYNAPLLVVISATDGDLMSLKDCCLAAENLMLAAADRGLGSCWIGFAEPWLSSPEGRAALDLPEGHVVVAPIILGRPASQPPRPPRKTPQVRWIAPVVVPA